MFLFPIFGLFTGLFVWFCVSVIACDWFALLCLVVFVVACGLLFRLLVLWLRCCLFLFCCLCLIFVAGVAFDVEVLCDVWLLTWVFGGVFTCVFWFWFVCLVLVVVCIIGFLALNVFMLCLVVFRLMLVC